MRQERRMVVSVLALVWGLVLLPAAASAQLGTSGIAGAVTDTTGGVLPGVTVEASSPALIEQVRTAVTDGQGRYSIVNLRPGLYAVTFTLPGFNAVRREGIELTANFTATVNAELRVGALEETITVSGASPVVDVQNTAARNLISRAVLDTVPTNKTLAAWAALTPGLGAGATALDVGGSKGEQSVRLAIHGGRGGEQRVLLDGMNASGISSYWGFMPDPMATQEVSVELGGGSAEFDLGGVQLNFIPKDGGNTFSGSFFTNYSDANFQGTNLSDEVAARGLAANSINAVDHIYDVNGSVGGPIKEDALWFYSAHRAWGNASSIAGMFFSKTPESWFYTADESRPGLDDYRQRGHNLRLTWQVSPRNKVRVSFDFQDHCDCHRGIRGGLTAPEAAHYRDYYPNNVPQASWTSAVSSRLLIEARASARIFDWTNLPQPDIPGLTADTISVLEQSTNRRYRAAENYGEHLSSGFFQRFSVSYVTGSHAFKTGLQVGEAWTRHKDDPGSGLQYTFNNGRPVQVRQFAVPATRAERMKAQLGLFVQDQWTIERLTLNMGLRFDYHNSFVPEQHLAAGPFVPARDSSVSCVPCWKDLSPRLSASYDLLGNGKTAVKVSVNRYVAEQTQELARANNPVETTVRFADRAWNDVNGDFVPQENELGPRNPTTFGQQIVTTRYAEDVLKGFGVRPYNWQTSANIQHELRPGVAVNVGYYRTSWHNFTATDNLLVTPDDYDPYCVTAPADSRLPTGGGYAVCGLYDITPSKFGARDNLVVRAARFGKRTEIYNGVDVTLNARLPGGAFVGGGTSSGSRSTNQCFVVDNPQDLRFCEVTAPYQTQLKFNGGYPLPWDLQLSGIFQSLPGIQVRASHVATTAEVARSLGRPLAGGARTVTIGVTQGLVEPETIYEDRIFQLDLRVIRIFRVGGARIQGMVDLYNVFNASPILSINERFGSAWLRPTEILGARLFKFGVQMDF